MTWLLAIITNDPVIKDDFFDVNSKPALNDFDLILVEKYNFEEIGEAAKARKFTQEVVAVTIDANNEKTDQELVQIFLDINGDQQQFGI